MLFKSPEFMYCHKAVLKRRASTKSTNMAACTQEVESPPVGVAKTLSSASENTHLIDASIADIDVSFPLSEDEHDEDDRIMQLLSSMVKLSDTVLCSVLDKLMGEIEEEEDEEEEDDCQSMVSDITDIFEECSYKSSSRRRRAALTLTRSLGSGSFQVPQGIEVSHTRSKSLGSGGFPAVARSLGSGEFPMGARSLEGDFEREAVRSERAKALLEYIVSRYGNKGKHDKRLFGEKSVASPEHEKDVELAMKAWGMSSVSRSVTSKPLDDPFPFDEDDERLAAERDRRAIEEEQELRELRENEDPIIGMTIECIYGTNELN